MPKKQYNIRWKQSDVDELQRLINNFNNKLYRMEKSGKSENLIMPERVKKSEITARITTRQDLQRELKSLERFTKRGAEKPVKTKESARTKWEIDEFRRKQNRINRQKRARREELGEKEVTTRGRSTGVKRKEMGRVKELSQVREDNRDPLKMKDEEFIKAKRNIENALNPMTNEFAKHNAKLNYIKGLRNAGFSEDIVDLVRKTDIDEFVDTINLDEQADFDFIYDEIEFQGHQEILRETWENAVKRSAKRKKLTLKKGKKG